MHTARHPTTRSVLAHARALLASAPAGATDYIDAGLRDTGRLLDEAARTLDLAQPVAITLIAILHHVSDCDEAVAQWNKFGKPTVTLRSPEQVAGLLDGLEIIEPGVVPTPQWRPAAADIGRPARDVDQFCAVARKP